MKGRLVVIKLGDRRRTIIQIGENPKPLPRGEILYQVPAEAKTREELIEKLEKHKRKQKRGS